MKPEEIPLDKPFTRCLVLRSTAIRDRAFSNLDKMFGEKESLDLSALDLTLEQLAEAAAIRISNEVLTMTLKKLGHPVAYLPGFPFSTQQVVAVVALSMLLSHSSYCHLRDEGVELNPTELLARTALGFLESLPLEEQKIIFQEGNEMYQYILDMGNEVNAQWRQNVMGTLLPLYVFEWDGANHDSPKYDFPVLFCDAFEDVLRIDE